MRRAADLTAVLPVLDDVQREAVDFDGRALTVIGAPGTGKTVTAVEMVVAAVARGVRPEHCLLLSPTRVAAGALRDRVTSRLWRDDADAPEPATALGGGAATRRRNAGTTTEPVSRTHQALGFGLLRQAAALRGLPAPRLLNGPEQDVVLKELLEGYAAGDAPEPPWPSYVREALPTRGFRAELRDLLMRAVEWGQESDDLRRLGVEHERPEWVAAADVLDDYDEVTALSRPGAYDPAWILGSAADLLQEDDEALRRVRDTVRFVVVDDAQELTSAAARLLRVVVGAQTQVRLIADPDSTVQGFRGAEPGLFAALAQEWDAGDARRLEVSYRQPQALRAVGGQVSARIGAVAGAAHREVVTRPGGVVEVALLRAVSQEAAHVAGLLRRAHLIDGVPWQDLAVIVRGQGRTGALRRALAASGVPVAVPPTTVPLRDEPAVRPFLALIEVALSLASSGEPASSDEPSISAEVATDVLTSPLGGADAVALRRMRRALRSVELEAGGTRTGDELLAASVLDAGQLTLYGPEVAPARRVARVVQAGVEAAGADDATAETLLWAMWRASGLADPWSSAALAGGPAGARADRDLDAVVALFGAAAAYVDRLPQSGPADFLEHVRGQDVPGDTLVARAPDDECVALMTPAGAAGREWHTVVVAGVQEGVWPDLRLRGSLLGSEHLVDVLTGRGRTLRAAQAAVRYDETRQFLVAVSRARERLVVTAVRSEDEQPSAYLDIVDPLDTHGDSDPDGLRDFTDVQRPMTLQAAVAELRREVAIGDDEERAEAVTTLSRLAREHVPGADPASWWALTELSDDRPLREPEQQVGVSPSKVDQFATCGLNWLLTSCGGEGPDLGAATLGTLVHEVAAELGDTEPERMQDVLDERWPRLGLGEGWISERKRQEAHRMLDKLAGYLDSAEANGWHKVAVEIDFEAEVGRALLRGRVDRLERHDERGLRIIDLKTGSSKPTKDKLVEHPQLGAYQVAVAEGAFEEGDVSGGAALVQLGKAGLKNSADVQAQPAIEPGDETSWAHEVVRATADGMGAATFVATVGDRCGVCPVRRSCPLQPEGQVI
ncbi:ATP-dependent helicase [Luteipulveratus mongoliensis]|uniref:DNA 3'-5' helicase n=1 Tax=Luteipulveratus mongoliensis TaxID=571913 RepID=A0A0K1JQZ0_9MICO|nr:ATP-dependent DNA helicase [Luteipulveratus mongoliensis]AKU19139.1 UvrD/REP helicase [Luteipulveratus mongoliensis]